MPTIVFVADDAIHPINSGGRLELHGELRALASAGFEVHLVVFHREEIADDDRRRTAELVASAHFVERVGFVRATIRHPLQPFQISSRVLSQEVLRDVVRVAGEVDAVLASHEWTLPAAQRVAAAFAAPPVLLRSHNDESAYFRSLTRHAVGVKRAYLLFESRRVDAALANPALWRGVRGVAVISAADAPAYRRAGLDVTIIPPTFVAEAAVTRVAPLARRSIGFVGALDSSHTEEGLRWFVSEVFSPLHADDPLTELVIAGRRASAELADLLASRDGVRFLGEVDDPAEVYSAARIFVNPIFSGSGVNMKVGPPMAHGLPVVTTSLGARGLSALEPALTTADDPEEMRRCVTRLLNDDAACAEVIHVGLRALESHSPAVTGALFARLISTVEEAP